jgi:hypothetical protein
MEVVIGGLVLVPVVLLATDAAIVLIASRTNHQIAQKAARTAANCRSSDEGQRAAQEAVRAAPRSDIIAEIELENFEFTTSTKLVTLTIDMRVVLSIPLPGMREVHLKAVASEPIVSIPAAR